MEEALASFQERSGYSALHREHTDDPSSAYQGTRPSGWVLPLSGSHWGRDDCQGVCVASLSPRLVLTSSSQEYYSKTKNVTVSSVMKSAWKLVTDLRHPDSLSRNVRGAGGQSQHHPCRTRSDRSGSVVHTQGMCNSSIRFVTRMSFG
jgi:hypothetical protein